MTSLKKPPLELRLRVLSAIDYAPGNSIQARIKSVSERSFKDEQTDCVYQFTWRTISTWLYRFKKRGITTLDNKARSDKNSYRKIQVNELAEAINDIIPTLSKNKVGVIPKMTLYRKLMANNYFKRSQLSQTSFYRMVRENDLLNFETTKKLRQSFCMQFAYMDVGKGREQDAEALLMSYGKLTPCMVLPLNKLMDHGKRPF